MYDVRRQVEASRAAAAEDHTLQLPDLGVILLGYLMMSAMVRFGWCVYYLSG